MEDKVSPTCMYVRSCIFRILLTWETRVDAPRCIWLAKGRLLDGQHATRHKACHWWPIVPACENTAFTFAAIGWKKNQRLAELLLLLLLLYWFCGFNGNTGYCTHPARCCTEYVSFYVAQAFKIQNHATKPGIDNKLWKKAVIG